MAAIDDTQPSNPAANGEAHITVRDLTMAYGSFVLMRNLNFTVKRGDIFIIMGGSGCGKSTLLRHLIGLKEPATGEILYDDFNFTKAEPDERELMLRRFGILYQSGALFSSMTLSENIGLPLGEFTDLGADEIRKIASLKLALVGLKGFRTSPPARSAVECKNGPVWRARWPWTRDFVFRRAVGGSGSNQLQPAGPVDPGAAR